MRIPSTRGLCRALHRFALDRQGVVAAITAMLVIPLVLAIGLAIDASRMFLVRAKLSQAVDAAALAAGQASDAAAVEADAQRIFAINYPEAYMGAGVDRPEVNYDEDTGQVEIIARTALPTVFMQLAHVDTLDVEARALVVREQRGMELALVLDVTGSMCQPCTKRDGLKQAARDLIGIVYGPNDTAEDLYVAVVPFAERVNIGNTTTRRNWLSPRANSSWNGCTDQRSGDAAIDDTPPANAKFSAVQSYSYSYRENGRTYTATDSADCPSVQVLPLTASKQTVLSRINALGASGYTRIDIAAGWGWRVLSERWQGLWGATGLPLGNDAETSKVVVLMTDGQNDVKNTYPDPGEKTLEDAADQSLADACEMMKENEIIIFTVAFQAPEAVQPLLRECASSPANYFNSPTVEDLRRSFRQIAGRLSALRLAE